MSTLAFLCGIDQNSKGIICILVASSRIGKCDDLKYIRFQYTTYYQKNMEGNTFMINPELHPVMTPEGPVGMSYPQAQALVRAAGMQLHPGLIATTYSSY